MTDTTNKVYVLRTTIFGYDDEYFHVHHEGGGPIAGIYTDRESAMAAWRRLEAEALSQRQLECEPRFFETPDDENARIDALIFARTGKHIADTHTVGERQRVTIYQDALEELSDEDLFLVLDAAGSLAYVLTEFEVGDKFYVRWLVREQRYQAFDRDQYGYGEGPTLCFATDPVTLAECARDQDDWEDPEAIVLDGAPGDLSSTPDILKALIAQYPSLHYDDSAQRLTIEPVNGPAFCAVNAVLKAPLFEIREVSRDELFRIQQQVLGAAAPA